MVEGIALGASGQLHGYGAATRRILSDDGRYAHCTRAERSGGLPVELSDTFAHLLDGECRCGETHGSATRLTEAKKVVSKQILIISEFMNAPALANSLPVA